MLNKLILTAIAVTWLFLVKSSFVYPTQHTNDELFPYVENYYKKFVYLCPKKKDVQDVNYTIKFEKLDEENWIGVCKPKHNGYEIGINADWWGDASLRAREQLMAHELTHCVLDMDHSGDPYNYMYYMENYIPYNTFQKQLEADMVTYCNE